MIWSISVLIDTPPVIEEYVGSFMSIIEPWGTSLVKLKLLNPKNKLLTTNKEKNQIQLRFKCWLYFTSLGMGVHPLEPPPIIWDLSAPVKMK